MDFDQCLQSISPQTLLLVLDGVQDPHNLGACLRSADACGVDAVIIPRDRTVKVNATVRKVAAGGAETVPVIEVTNLARCLKDLKQAGVWIYGTSGEASDSIYDHDYHGPVALVMGAEGSGLRRLTMESCDHLVKLPMHGQVESLNVSVATGVCLYEVLRSRSKPAVSPHFAPPFVARRRCEMRASGGSGRYCHHGRHYFPNHSIAGISGLGYNPRSLIWAVTGPHHSLLHGIDPGALSHEENNATLRNRVSGPP